MYLYVVTLKKEPDHIRAYNEAFDITVDAPDVPKAIELVKKQIINEGVIREMEDRPIPRQENLNDLKDNSVIIEVDFGANARRMATGTVKRTITVPEWMDMEIRRKKIDASGLFREAYLQKYDNTDDTTILSVEDLETKVDPRILKGYVKKFLNTVI